MVQIQHVRARLKGLSAKIILDLVIMATRLWPTPKSGQSPKFSRWYYINQEFHDDCGKTQKS